MSHTKSQHELSYDSRPLEPPILQARSSRAIRVLKLTLLISLTTAAVLYLSSNPQIFAQLTRIRPAFLILLLLCQVIAALILNWASYLPLRKYAPKLRYWELFALRSGAFLAGHLLPVAGSTAVKASYLRSIHDVSLPNYFATILYTNLLRCLSAGILSIIALLAVYVATDRHSIFLCGIAGFSLIGSLLFLRLPVKFQSWPSAVVWLGPLLKAQRSFVLLTGSSRLFAAVSILGAIHLLLTALVFGSFYASLAGSLGEGLFAAIAHTASAPSRIMTITPGGLGVYDWLVALSGASIQLDLGKGLLAALLLRAAGLVAQALLCLVAIFMWKRTPTEGAQQLDSHFLTQSHDSTGTQMLESRSSGNRSNS